MDVAETGLLRALCFFDALSYAPTQAEWCLAFDRGHGEGEATSLAYVRQVSQRLLDGGRVLLIRGRVCFPGRLILIEQSEARASWMPRKLRQAERVVSWLRRLKGIRFVALCNTTALGTAREDADLDFFVVVRRGALWQTRLLAALPFVLLRRRPSFSRSRDAVCLSFFVDEEALDLSSLQLAPTDPYFRFWFFSLLPLFDDGVSSLFWQTNQRLLSFHPFATPWPVHSDVMASRPFFQWPVFSLLERLARSFQMRAFPLALRARINQDTCVVVSDHVLKFHVEDGRAAFRALYEERCARYGLSF